MKDAFGVSNRREVLVQLPFEDSIVITGSTGQ